MPIPIAVMAAAAVLKTGVGIFSGLRQAQSARDRGAAVIQNIEDQIAFERIISARKNRKIAGSGQVAAAASGVQFSGSFVDATEDAVFENQFESLIKIHDLQYKKRLTAFDTAIGNLQGISNAAGAVIGGGQDAVSVGQIARREDLLKSLLAG